MRSCVPKKSGALCSLAGSREAWFGYPTEGPPAGRENLPDRLRCLDGARLAPTGAGLWHLVVGAVGRAV